MGEYSASYGDTAYTLGFHDGMEAEQEHKEIAGMSRQEESRSGFSLEHEMTGDEALFMSLPTEKYAAVLIAAQLQCAYTAAMKKVFRICQFWAEKKIIIENRKFFCDNADLPLLQNGLIFWHRKGRRQDA